MLFGSTGFARAARWFAGAGISSQPCGFAMPAWDMVARIFLEITMKLLDKTMMAVLLGGDVSYDALRKHAFHLAGKRLMRRIAGELSLAKEQYDLRSNLGGIAVSGEVTLHTDTLYLQLSQWALSGGRASIFLYRRCAGRKDYAGETNQWIAVERLLTADGVQGFLQSLLVVGGLQPASAYKVAA